MEAQKEFPLHKNKPGASTASAAPEKSEFNPCICTCPLPNSSRPAPLRRHFARSAAALTRIPIKDNGIDRRWPLSPPSSSANQRDRAHPQ